MDVLPVELWLGIAEYQKWPQHTSLELLDDELAAEFRARYPGPSYVITINGPGVPAKHKPAILARYPSLVYRAVVSEETAAEDVHDTRGAQYVTLNIDRWCKLHIHGSNSYVLTLRGRKFRSHMPPQVKELDLGGICDSFTCDRRVTCAATATGRIATLTVPTCAMLEKLRGMNVARIVETIKGGAENEDHCWGEPAFCTYHVPRGTHGIILAQTELPAVTIAQLLQQGRVSSLRCLDDCMEYPLDILRDVRTVELVNVTGLEGRSMAPLGRAYLVNLEDSDVTDVSALGDVPLLCLRGCVGVRDVSKLGRNRELDLAGCVNIRDVSALGRVHKLSLANTWVRDVSALGAVHSLDLSGCGRIETVNSLGGNHFLNLSRVTTFDAIIVHNLRWVDTLVLSDCAGIESIGPILGKNRILVVLGVCFYSHSNHTTTVPSWPLGSCEHYEFRFSWEPGPY